MTLYITCMCNFDGGYNQVHSPRKCFFNASIIVTITDCVVFVPSGNAALHVCREREYVQASSHNRLYLSQSNKSEYACTAVQVQCYALAKYTAFTYAQYIHYCSLRLRSMIDTHVIPTRPRWLLHSSSCHSSRAHEVMMTSSHPV